MYVVGILVFQGCLYLLHVECFSHAVRLLRALTQTVAHLCKCTINSVLNFSYFDVENVFCLLTCYLELNQYFKTIGIVFVLLYFYYVDESG